MNQNNENKQEEVKNEVKEEVKPDIFEPEDDWKEVLPGQEVPGVFFSFIEFFFY